MTGSYRAFGVLNPPVGNLASKLAMAAAGCTHIALQAQWSSLQPNGAGTSLDPTAVASLIQEYADSATARLAVMLEVAVHYPPAWAVSAIEGYTDQFGNVYSNSTPNSGMQVVNWMWTALGWTYVADFIGKLAAALGPALLAQTAAIKCGGGYYGELHYPQTVSVITLQPSVWAYGASMQTGTGLAAGQSVCPLPGYTIWSGTDAQDCQLINWYANGLATWLAYFIATMRAAGWACDYHVCHPGYGTRSNQLRSAAAYRASIAAGEDPLRMIGSYAHDPQIWPYSTWLNTADGFDTPVQDSDIAAWKKIYEEAYRWNKHYKLWGENTGGESTTQMGQIFLGYSKGSALSGSSVDFGSTPPLPPAQTFGFQGCFWLNYASLITGGTQASLSDYAANIAAHTATI